MFLSRTSVLGGKSPPGPHQEAIKAVAECDLIIHFGFRSEGLHTKRRVYDPVIQAVSGLAEAQGALSPASCAPLCVTR